MKPRTIVEKIWDSHVVNERPGGGFEVHYAIADAAQDVGINALKVLLV